MAESGESKPGPASIFQAPVQAPFANMPLALQVMGLSPESGWEALRVTWPRARTQGGVKNQGRGCSGSTTSVSFRPGHTEGLAVFVQATCRL